MSKEVNSSKFSEDFVKLNLTGPAFSSENALFYAEGADIGEYSEIVDFNPALYYSTAILFPAGKAESDPALEDDISDRPDAADEDMGTELFPSSMGLSIHINKEAKSKLTDNLRLTVSGIQYSPVKAGIKLKYKCRITRNIKGPLFPPDFVSGFNKRFKDLLELSQKEEENTFYVSFSAPDGNNTNKENNSGELLDLLSVDIYNQFKTKYPFDTFIGERIDVNEQEEKAKGIKKDNGKVIRCYVDTTFKFFLFDNFNDASDEHKKNGWMDSVCFIDPFVKLFRFTERFIYGILRNKRRLLVGRRIEFELPSECFPDFVENETVSEVSRPFSPFADNPLKIVVGVKYVSGNDSRFVKIMVANMSEGHSSRNGTLSLHHINTTCASVFNAKLTISEKKKDFLKNYHTEENKFYDMWFNPAIGHGTASGFRIIPETGLKDVFTDFLPSYCLPETSPDPVNESGTKRFEKLFGIYEMSLFSGIIDNDIIKNLNDFANDYLKWCIKSELEDSKKDADRILSNIVLLQKEKAMQAFRLMNSAILMQMYDKKPIGKNLDEHVLRKFYTDNKPSLKNFRWRGFQLGFILLNLDAFIENKNIETSRNKITDLIWFPTGGGKTEAYLGLIAFVICMRRLSDPHDNKISCLMRYTLRMLTAEQLQRAARLIASLEILRISGLIISDVRIITGLYVGQGSTPNTLKKLGEKIENSESLPLKDCPWCGTPLMNNVHNYKSTGQNKLLKCHSESCHFYQYEIPVYLCDEQIYKFREKPSLLFATVDKMATMAHKVETIGLFRDIDIIIQDELHLLTGPLGSAVALFEKAFREITARKKEKQKLYPKVIASTATSKNSKDQVNHLYGTDINIFPKPGLKCSDSWFASFERSATHPGYVTKRTYVGILPSGKSQTWMELRIAALHLLSRARFERFSDEEWFHIQADNHFTVLMYYHALREIGRTESRLQNWLPDDMRVIWELYPDIPLFSEFGLKFDDGFSYLKQRQLTGRQNADEIFRNKKEIEQNYTIEQRRKKGNTLPPDVVLSTNMIAAGIDIHRFNCMIMSSMPRGNAEYIQATSRVARRHNGTVYLVHHPMRNRDLSHYESFSKFHQRFYSEVEPVSITPFAGKALEKYLSLTIITLIRHKIEQLAKSPAEFVNEEIRNKVIQLINELFENSHIDNNQITTLNSCRDQILNEWATRMPDNYKASSGLFVDIHNPEDSLWKVPYSLRIVQPETAVTLNNTDLYAIVR